MTMRTFAAKPQAARQAPPCQRLRDREAASGPDLFPGTMGNQAVQAKLTVGAPGDSSEQEADRVSEQVMRMPEPAQPAAPLRTGRAPAGGPGQTAAPPIVQEALASPGQPLDPGTRSFMESRFGRDFGPVRVHADGKAAESAEAVSALAYTAGRHVVFGAGRYAPGTPAGNRLLAHELAHTLQQGQGTGSLQRAIKLEIQTSNHVWAVKRSGRPDPRLLPRKYAPTSKGYRDEFGEESGDKPAYLSAGHKGGPARAKGSTSFVEVEGPLTMKEAKGSTIDPAKDAQIVRVYKLNVQVLEADLIGKAVGAGQLSLLEEIDNSGTAGTFNPNTFEIKYVNADGTPLDVHLNPERVFEKGHVKLMEVRRLDKPGIDKKKAAQFVETWKVTIDPSGTVDFFGRMAKVELLDKVDNAKSPAMAGAFNKSTWEKNYFMAVDFTGNVLDAGAKPLDMHLDTDGRFRMGRVKLMEKEKLKAAEEQTAIELQSEHGGVLEFETPKWFRDWPELEERVQEAVDMTTAMNKEIGTSEEVTDKTPPEKKVLDAIDRRKTSSALGNVVKWPAAYSTAHLKNLRADKRHLLVQIVDKDWHARIQASEGIALSKFGSLQREHEGAAAEKARHDVMEAVFGPAFAAAKLANPALNEANFANLKGFLQLVITYIFQGQRFDMTGQPAKTSFFLMARTDFASMYRTLLGADEKSLFKTLAGDPRKASDNPILAALQASVDTMRAANGMSAVSLDRTTRFFTKGFGSKVHSAGPTIYAWLRSIVTKGSKASGKDLLSVGSVSDAMGARTVSARAGAKDYKQVRFEVRGTIAHGTNDRPAKDWLSFAEAIFQAAKERSADTPDDPATPKVNEASRTSLKD